jgi:hypothetical protein
MKVWGILVGTFALAVSALALDAEAIYRQASPAVMTILVKDKKGEVVGNGTAFMISNDGLAVTAYHVLADAERASVRFVDGTTADVEGIVDGNKDTDVAIIRVKAKLRPVMQLASDLPGVGSPAFVIGAPKGLEFSISEGIVNRLGTDSGVKVIQFSAPVSPGNSGSPLIDRFGRAVGVVSFQRNDGQNLNFAVPNRYIGDLSRTRVARSLPLVHVVAKKDPVWSTFEFKQSCFSIDLPGVPKCDDKTTTGELAESTLRFESSSVQTNDGNIDLSYFEFKPGYCPKPSDVAREIKRERQKIALPLDKKDLENPSTMEFEADGIDEGHAVVVSFMDKGRAVVECTAIVRKGNRLMLVVVTYDAENESGLAQLEKVFGSIKAKSN